ncbi:aldehyde dehydrogenase family 8 member A1-like protein [Leptotrombidium deliense]|uniref:Aldehyde dehydrogenase family 8 member A1-like protein n=1 Tax=Leptotrombidium deliense TaxID=299467 RepID=A0A443SIF3_9ACAR|nr:aldehyde dehydrogenase family 8 member A1-like protein [Leptotrombidium deliense]
MANVVKIRNFVNGQFTDCNDYIESLNPSTGDVLALIPNSGEHEVQSAVAAAKAAFNSWSKTSVDERARILFKIADLIETQNDQLAYDESLDQGKPVWLSKTMDIPRAVANFRHFATAIKCDNEIASMTPENVVNYTIHEPVGVAGIITPWNLPLYLLTFKLAPAIAYGNTVVAKPSEITSLTAFKLCKIFEEAGLPSGVINVIFGHGRTAGEALVKHPDVNLISFTGSTATGIRIAETTAPFFKKLSLEMGGKNAAIVFNDVDVAAIVPSILRSSFLNQGEICLSSSRIYVQKDIFQLFVQSFVSEMKKLKVGDPFDKDVFIGPLVSKQHLEKVKSYLDISVAEKADIFSTYDLSLPAHCKNGYFFPPTVITNISNDSRCMTEEIFGPIVCILPFDTETEVIQKANGVKYGLSATIWTKDVNKVHRVARQLQVGTVWVNCWLIRNLHMPFGGMKLSGVGREGTVDSRHFYTEKKTVCIKIDH